MLIKVAFCFCCCGLFQFEAAVTDSQDDIGIAQYSQHNAGSADAATPASGVVRA